MYFEGIRAAVLTLMSQPMAVAAVVVLAGINAAIWLLVFERVGFPTALASLLLVPPFTFLLPLYVAMAHWPGPGLVRAPTRIRRFRRTAQRVARQGTFARPALATFHPRLPLRLDENGLPRVRIPLEDPVAPPGWSARRDVGARYPHR